MRKEDLLKFLEAWPKTEEVTFEEEHYPGEDRAVREYYFDRHDGKLHIVLRESL